MFILWGGLTGLYLVSSFQLLLQGDNGGAAIVAAVAALLGFLCRRSWLKRKRKKLEKQNKEEAAP